jgi:diguanylate cyclase (GGDEF)-like protein
LVTIARRQECQPFNYENWQVLATIAQQASQAIHSEHLMRYTQDQINQLSALQATLADISEELELPKLLEAILKRAVKLLNATGGNLGLFDEDRHEIKIVASYNLERDYTGARLAIGEGAIGLALEMQQPFMVEDYSTWYNASPQYREGPWHSVLAVPFLSSNRIVGVIGIVDESPFRKFSPSDQHQLGVFAQHAAIAVDKAHLYQAAREAAERRAILHQVSQQIVSASLDLEGIYEAIHQAARHLMPAEAFVIVQYDEIRQTIQDAYLVDRNGRADLKVFPADQGLSGKVISSGQTIYIEDLMEDPDQEMYLHFGGEEEVRSVLAVPMRLRGKVNGMLSVQSYFPRAYTSEDKYLLEMLASYAAIAIDNASMFFNIQQLATTDSVTGLFNRRHLFDLGRQEFLRAKRFNRSLSVIMMDIDHFKLVNDRYGHATGDQVLLKLGRLIQSEIREVDVVGRYGGEEFTIILPETSLHKAFDVAERLRRKINKTFYSVDHSTPEITVSIGVATIEADTQDFNELVNDSDVALYAAKEAGRNRVETKPVHKINIASPNE